MNITEDVVIHRTGAELDDAIRTALKTVAEAYLVETGLTDLDLHKISTKTNVDASFAKFANLGVLKSGEVLGEDYIQLAMRLYCSSGEKWTAIDVEKFFYTFHDQALEYRESFGRRLRPGVGAFLLALHVRRIINLPWTFDWPSNRKPGTTPNRVVKRIAAHSELIGLFAGLSRSDESRDNGSPFEQIMHSEKRYDWFRTYGMKLLLATGWVVPEEVNLAELMEIQRIAKIKGIGKQVSQVLLYAFKERCNLSAESLREISRKKPKSDSSVRSFIVATGASADEIFDHLAGLKDISFAWPGRILASISEELSSSTSRYWSELGEAFLRYRKYESPKGPKSALAVFNLYMFYYLPKWFAENRDTQVAFPETPDKLVGGIFISRVIAPQTNLPRTFIEFSNLRAEKLEQSGNYQYSQTKALQSFFDFIVERSSELPDCAEFKQPFGRLDHARTTGSVGTNKRPIPRRLFPYFINYIECIRAYTNVVTERVISTDKADENLYLLAQQIENVTTSWIDTFELSVSVGFVPIMFTKNKTIPLRYLQYLPTPEWLRLSDGRLRYLPRPHALNQILVALYTGLRHNHIQWLDSDLFDFHVNDENEEYAYLVVNTDKAKKKPWSPMVNRRVIELLRSQREWRNMIGESGFNLKIKYNDNTDSAYPAFRPLFSYFKDGRPHSDNTYTAAWKDILSGFSGIVPDLIELKVDKVAPLFRLRPPGVAFNDIEVESKLKKYANEEVVCPLYVQTDMTPHSTRVSLVSSLITYLPAELIGRYFTGQTEGMVYHYVSIDPSDVKELEAKQALIMRDQALKYQFEREMGATPNVNSTFVRADSVSSNLARSMSTNLDESIIRYGCFSISIHEDEDSGLDVIKERGIDQAAFNKTEICPYGNNCPPAIIKDLKGIRRCALCPYAVRSIDHLPAICAKKKQVAESISELECRIVNGETTKSYTLGELDTLEEERQRLCEELAAWSMCEAFLERLRKDLTIGVENRKWLVAQPEVLQRNLLRVEVPTQTTEYLLARLQECLAYPGMQSPQISKQLDLLRRRLLAKAGNLKAAFNMDVPVDAAAECAGVIRTIVAAHGISPDQVYDLLTGDAQLHFTGAAPLLEMDHE